MWLNSKEYTVKQKDVCQVAYVKVYVVQVDMNISTLLSL